MDTISWRDEFSVGVTEMDSQHKKLISMVNRLIEEEKKLTSPETIAELLTAMTDYAQEHFRAEEYLMAEYGFDHLDRQKLQHQGFIDKTREFVEVAGLGPNILSTALLDYLSNWLISHILTEDMQYRTFFADKGVN